MRRPIEERHQDGDCGGDCPSCHAEQERDYFDRRERDRSDEYARYVEEAEAEDHILGWLALVGAKTAAPQGSTFNPDTVPF